MKKSTILFVVVFLFLLRGILQITMVPPLEGFDSIGHIDYLQYLKDHSERSLKHMPFSYSSLELYSLFPTGKHNSGEEYGGKQYESYYKRDNAQFDSLKAVVWNKKFIPENKGYLDTAENWQRKHPPLYYSASNILVNFINPAKYMNGYFLYNLFSLLMLSLTIFAVYRFGKELDFLKTASSRSFLLLYISQPMIYIVACRITNDALAYPLNALICLLWWKNIKAVHSESKFNFVPALAAGLLTGISLLVKTYALLFIPVVVIQSAIGFLVTRKRGYLTGTILFVIASLVIAFQLLYSNFMITGQIDGNQTIQDMAQSGIAFSFMQKFIEFYLISIKGYIQTVMMLTCRIWVGNWSSLANIPIVYLLYLGVAVFAFIEFLRKIKSSSIKLDSTHTQFFIFSLLLQLILLAGLMRLGLQTATSAGRVTAVAGYYSYAFYLTELYIFWFLFKDSVRFNLNILLYIFLFTDLCGCFTEIVYYYGAGEIGPARVVIPHREFLTQIFHNWHYASWTVIPAGIWLSLYFVFIISVLFLSRSRVALFNK